MYMLQVLVFIKSDFWEFYSAFQSSLTEQEYKVIARKMMSVYHLNFFPFYLVGEATGFANTKKDVFINMILLSLNS